MKKIFCDRCGRSEELSKATKFKQDVTLITLEDVDGFAVKSEKIIDFCNVCYEAFISDCQRVNFNYSQKIENNKGE